MHKTDFLACHFGTKLYCVSLNLQARELKTDAIIEQRTGGGTTAMIKVRLFSIAAADGTRGLQRWAATCGSSIFNKQAQNTGRVNTRCPSIHCTILKARPVVFYR